MNIRHRIEFDPSLPDDTRSSVREYLSRFCNGAFSIEHFDRRMAVNFEEPLDAAVVSETFASVIKRSEAVY